MPFRRVMYHVPCLEKKLTMVSSSQLRYRSAICVHVLSERLRMRSRLWPPHDVYSRATWIYTPSSSVSLSSCLISIATACSKYVFFYNFTPTHSPSHLNTVLCNIISTVASVSFSLLEDLHHGNKYLDWNGCSTTVFYTSCMQILWYMQSVIWFTLHSLLNSIR
jgi:hypothetical protein